MTEAAKEAGTHSREANAPQPFLAQLRSSTAASHDALEANPYSRAIIDGTISKDDYRHFLMKFYGFYKPVEEAIYNQENIPLTDIDARRRAALILNDLDSLGYEVTASDIPLCNDLPELGSEASRWGCLYVLEGSRLGGQVISRKVSATLGLPLGTGSSFFLGRGKDTGKLWKDFLGSFTAYAAASGREEEIISSAEETFTKIKHWLSTK